MSMKRDAYLTTVTNEGQWNQIKIQDEIIIARDKKGTAVRAWCNKDSKDLGTHDKSVSSPHARVFVKDGKWYVQDLGSLNGTWINGLPLKGWRKPRKTKDRTKSDEMEIAKSTQILFGAFTTGSISFAKNCIIIEGGETVDLPISIINENLARFHQIERHKSRSTVKPLVDGTLSIRSGKFSQTRRAEKKAISHEENLKKGYLFACQCLKSLTESGFEGHLGAFLEHIEMFSTEILIEEAILKEGDIRRFYKKEHDREGVARSRKRMKELLHEFCFYVEGKGLI